MPYDVKRDSRCPDSKPFGVVTQGSNNLHGCHKTRKSAIQQQRALYVHAPDDKKEIRTKAPVKREGGIDRPARDYAYVPNPNLPATWALPLTDAPGVVSLSRLGMAAAAISPGGNHGVTVRIPASALSAVKRRILGEYRRLKVPDEKIPVTVKGKKSEAGGQFTLWKDKNTGNYRWMAIYSNNFLDRDTPPEIISEKSHRTFVKMVDEGIVDYPELWHWHIPGTVWGKADMLDYVDGFALAVGYVYPGHESEAEALMGRKDLGVSHGMPEETLFHDPQQPNVIDFHITKEISVLPHHAVANPLTDFVVLGNPGGNSMGVTTAKREWLINDLGLPEDFVKSLERNLKEMGKLASDLGIQSKDAATPHSKEAEADDEETYEDEDESYEDEETVEVENDEDEQEEKIVAVAPPSRRQRTRDEPPAKKEKMVHPRRPMMDDDEEQGKKPPAKKRKPMPRKKEAEPAVEEVAYVTREEVAEALSAVINPIMDSIVSMGEVLAQFGDVVKALAESDAEKIARTKENTPTLSLSEMLKERIPIGRKEAQVDGRTTLAKEGPQEAKQEVPAYTPSSFVNGLVQTAIHGTAQQAQ